MWKYRKVSELEKLAIWKGHFASLSKKNILEITENKTSNVRYFGNENRKLTSGKIFQITTLPNKIAHMISRTGVCVRSRIIQPRPVRSLNFQSPRPPDF